MSDYTKDILAIVERLRNVPNVLHYELGASAYQLLCQEIEPIVGDLEDEIKWISERDKAAEDSQ